MPAVKKNQMILSQLCPELASTQILQSLLFERIREDRNSKYESDWLKIVECFIDAFIGILLIDYLFIKILL